MGGYAVYNPALDGPPDLDRHDFDPVSRGGRLDLDAMDRIDQARTNQVPRVNYRQALEFFEELKRKGEGFKDRARSRDAEANYLLTVAIEHPHRAREMQRYSDLLRGARPHGLWQVVEKIVRDDDGELVIEHALKCEWFERAGLVKLCPDDAREEGMRVASKYGPRIAAAQRAGYEVRFAVATFPNSPRGFLAADIRAIKLRVRDWILYAKPNGRIARDTKDRKRVFYSLKGVLATVEAPLSRHDDWNVHINLILVFNDRPDYKALREAWGANIEFRTVPTGAGEAAIRELVKYPLQAVSFKSAEKAAAGKSRAPPMIEWPTDAFLEWWDAHKRYRRTCSWGELFGGCEEEPSPWLRGTEETLGRMFLSPAGFRAEPPMVSTVEWDELQEQRSERDRRQRDWLAGLDPAQRELFEQRETQQREHRELVRRLEAWVFDDAGPAEVDLILGDKSAKNAPSSGVDPPLD